MANKGAFINGDTGQTTSRELILLHGGRSFETREEAKQYIAAKVEDETINSTYAQPVVVRYKDNGQEQIILGIGKGDNGFHYIDSAAIEHDIKAIIESIGTSDEGIDVVYSEGKLVSVKDEIEKLNETIQNGDEETVFDTVNTVAAKVDEILGLISGAQGVSGEIAESVGLNADGTLPEYESTEYIADGQSIKAAVETLDESLAGLQGQVTANKVASADGSIVVLTDETGTDLSANADGTTVLVGEDGKISTGLWLKKYDENDNIGPNLLAVYKLVDKNGDPIPGSKDVEIPKDSSFVNAVLGTDEIYVDPVTGEIHDPGIEHGKKIDVLFLVYINNESQYIGVQIPLGDFLQEAEFKDGLYVSGHEVYVKLDATEGSDSAKFLYMKPIVGENGAIALSGITEAIEAAVAIETARAEVAEAGLHGEVVAEQERAEAAETLLHGEVVAEQERAEGVENAIKESVGLGNDGEYVAYAGGSFTSGATSVLEATTMLDDAVKNISGEVQANHVEGEDAIVVTTSATKTVVSLKVGEGDKLLTNDEDGLHTSIDLVSVTGSELADLGPDVKEAYKLTGVGSERIGQYIKIYRDSVIYKIAVGDMGDTFKNFEPGSAGLVTTNPELENISAGTTGHEAIRVIYDTGRVNASGDELYEMVLIDVDDFLQLDEFEDGLEVVQGDESKVVKVKIDTASEGFLTVSIDGVKLDGVQAAIDTAVEAEESRASLVESALTESIANEVERAEGAEERIKTAVGLDANGDYIKKEGTAYLDNAESIEEEIAALDEAAKANKIVGENAIEVTPTEDGTLVSLTVGENDKLLTNTVDGLVSTIDLEKVEGEELAALGENVREAYKLTGVEGAKIGEYIKIYKDAKIYSIALGDMGDTFKEHEPLEPLVTKYPDVSNISGGTTGQEALRVIELRADGLYEMNLINLDEFLQNDEFEDGLTTGTSTSGSVVVKVKIDEESEHFLTVSGDGVKLSGVQDAIDAERTRAEDAEESLDTKIENEISSARTEEARIEGKVDAEVVRATSAETELQEAITALDGKIDTEISRASGEENNIEGAVGLNSDGTYSGKTGTNYLDSATSVEGEIRLLDIEAARNSGETNAIETGVGLNEDGTHKPTTGHYTSNAQTIAGEIAALDAEAYRHSGETDTIESSVGLGENGAYVKTRSPYSSAATTTLAAIEAVDTQVAAEQSEIDAIESAVELNTDGTYKQTRTPYTSAATSVYKAMESLDTQVKSEQDEIDAVEASAGFGTSGSYVAYDRGSYTSGATTVLDATSKLDDAVKSVQEQVTANKIFGEDAIVVASGATGTTVSLKLKRDGILTNDENGLYSTINISALTASEIAELADGDKVKEAFKLVGADGVTAFGDIIKIYKDSALISVVIGDMGDVFAEPRIDKYHANHTNVEDGHTDEEALRFIYQLSDGTYQMVLVDLEDFLQETEFEDGFALSGHTVSVKLDTTPDSDSEKFLYMREISGEKGAVALSGITDAIDTAVAVETARAEAAEAGLHGEVVAEQERAEGVELDLRTGITANTASIAAEAVRAIGVEEDLQGQINDLSDDLDEEVARAEGKESTIIGGVGLNADGTHEQTSGHYTSGATTVVGEIDALDEKLFDVQSQITANKISGEDAIVVTTAETGTTVSLKLKSDNVLTNDEDGLYATLSLVSASTNDSTVKEAWKLVGTNGVQLGETIKVYKDATLYSVDLGKMDDRFANPTSDLYHSENPVIVAGETGSEALRFIFTEADGTYYMKLVNLESFINAEEIADGLWVDGNDVKVKVDNQSEEFLSVSANGVKVSGVQAAIDAAVGAEEARATSAETELQAAIDAEQTRAEDAEEALDAKIDAEEARAKAQEDVIEAGVGLSSVGTYVSKSGTNYLDNATSVEDEIRLLDIEAGRHSGETDTIESSVGLNADGTHKQASGHYTSGTSTITGEIAALDAEAYRHSGETDAIETAVGLHADGTYIRTITKYSSGATSVHDAIEAIDAQVTDEQSEIDAVEFAAGLNADGTYKPTRTAYTSGATSTYAAIEALDVQAAANQGETDTIETAVGLSTSGTYVAYANGAYTSNASSVLDATSKLDDAISDLQGQITSNKLVGDKAIEVASGATGSTVSLKLVDDGILTNSNDGLSATLKVKALTEQEIAVLDDASNVREAYKLVGKDDSTAFGTVIKVYKDSALYSVALGDMADKFTTSVSGDDHLTSNPDGITSGASGEEALRLIYSLEDGLYRMVLVSLEDFLQQSEFKDGFVISGNEVYVKLDSTEGSDSAKFLYMKPIAGENGAIALSGITEAIGAAVLAEEQRATGEEGRIEGRLDDEIARAMAAESASTAAVEEEERRAREAEEAIASDLADEVERALDAESAITEALEEEVGRATSAEGELDDKIDAEITSARTEESRIEGKVDDEISRATTQENTIEASVGLNEDGSHKTTSGNYTSGASTIAGEIAALDAQAKFEQDEIDAVESGAGLDSNGNYVPYVQGAYISSAESISEATEMLDDAISDVQAQITSNKVVGEKAIEVTTAATGTTVGLKLKGDDILTNDNDGLYATLSVVKLSSGDTEALGNNVREAYKVVGTDGETALGEVIKIYKDSSLYSVALGDMGDEFSNPTTDKYHSNDTNINSGSTGQEALRFIYLLSDGTYQMALIDLESFLQESEFEDGLVVSGNVVKVKVDAASEEFLSVSPNGVKLAGVQDAINVERDRAIAQENTIESSVGLAADGSHISTSGTYTSNATTVTGEIAALDAQAVANQAETDAIESGVGLASNGAYVPKSGTNYLDSATSVEGEIASLDAQAKSEQDEIDAIETAAGYASDGTYVHTTGEYTSAATSTKASIEALDAQAVNNQGETDTIESAVGLNADGTHIKKINSHYLATANTIAQEIEALDDEAARNAAENNTIENAVGLDTDGSYIPTTGNVTSAATTLKGAVEALDTAVVANDNELSRVENAVGLDSNGDYVKPTGVYVSGSTKVKEAVEALNNQAVSNQAETDYIETAVGLNADGTYKPTRTAYTSAATSTYAAIEALDVQESAMQSETDAIETSVGLNSDGTYNRTRTRYTSGATSVYDAIEALDVKASSENDEVDAVEAGVGLNADGTYIRTNDKYTSGATTMAGAIKALNDQAMEQQSELDTAEIALGLNADGTHKPSNGHYTSQAATLADEIAALDAEAYRHSGETDTIETAVGLNADGTYHTPSGAYVSASTSVMGAIESLNAQAVAEQGEIDTINDDLDVIRNNTGLAADGTHIPTNGHYTSGAGTVTAEIAALDAEAYRHSGETDAIETAVGLNSDGTFQTINGNYTSAATSVAGAISALDTAVKVNADAIEENTSDILKNRVYSASNAIGVEHTDTEGAGTKVSLIINSNDMILSQDAGLLATIHMEKVTGVTTAGTAYTEIQLLGKDRQVIDRIDASDFVKDGFLESVQVVTRNTGTFLVFTWNTASGGRVTEINVEDLFVPYTGSHGVRLVDNDFQGVVDPTSDSFLTVGLDGFKLSGVQEVVDAFEEATADINEKLVDIVSDNDALVITNEDQGFRKYRRLTVTLGDTLDTTEGTLPEKNYLRIASDGLHTTIRPLTDNEIHGITNIDNIQ